MKGSRSPGLLSGDRACKLIPERFNFLILGPWGGLSGLDPGEQVPARLSRDVPEWGCWALGRAGFPLKQDPGCPEPGKEAGSGFLQLRLIPGEEDISARVPCFGCGQHKGVGVAFVSLWVLYDSDSRGSGFDPHTAR